MERIAYSREFKRLTAIADAGLLNGARSIRKRSFSDRQTLAAIRVENLERAGGQGAALPQLAAPAFAVLLHHSRSVTNGSSLYIQAATCMIRRDRRWLATRVLQQGRFLNELTRVVPYKSKFISGSRTAERITSLCLDVP